MTAPKPVQRPVRRPEQRLSQTLSRKPFRTSGVQNAETPSWGSSLRQKEDCWGELFNVFELFSLVHGEKMRLRKTRYYTEEDRRPLSHRWGSSGSSSMGQMAGICAH